MGNELAVAGNYSIVLGPEYSSMTQLISPIGQVYDVPILTYGATSAYLSSKDDYPAVWRSVAPDSVRVLAWVDLCVFYQWSHVIVLVEPSLYSEGAGEYFQLLGAKAGLFVTVINIKSRSSTPSVLDRVRATNIKIIFAPVINWLIPLAEEAVRTKMVGSDAFIPRDQDESFTYDPSIDPFDTFTQPDFIVPNATKKRTVTLKKNVRSGDPRVQGYVWIWGDSASVSDHHFRRVWPGSFTATEPTAEIEATFNITKLASLYASSTAKVRQAYDSINLTSSFRKNQDASLRAPFSAAQLDPFSFFPTAIARAFISVCDVADEHYKAFGSLPTSLQLVDAMRRYRKSIFGTEFFYDSNQEFPNSHMLIVNPTNDVWATVIGTWAKDEKLVLKNKIKVHFGDGTTRVPDDGIALETYVFTSGALGISIITSCLVFMIIVIITGFFVFRYWGSPIVRLASPHQLVVILIGLFFITMGLVFYVGRPNRALCVLRIWPYYIGMSLVFSPVITKTWRVWMVFRGANQLKKMVITNRRLGIYTSILVIPTVLLSIFRTILDNTSDTRAFFPPLSWGVASSETGVTEEYGQQRVDVICAIPSPIWSYIQLGYLGVQMLTALFLAWKTRNVPTGFNETKYVFISVYATSIIGTIGLITSNILLITNPNLSSAILVYSLLAFCATTWGLLFIPKLYIALVRPERNNIDLMKVVGGGDYDAWEGDDGSSYRSMIDRPPPLEAL